MGKYDYSVVKLTRALTALCLSVVLCVGVYAFFLAAKKSIFRTASSGVTLKPPVMIIDPGHGGEDGGTVSVSGTAEKEINLDLSLSLREFFRFFGFETVMTREEDCLIYGEGAKTIREKKVSDIRNRMKIIEETPGCIFLSIHQNHYSVEKYNGTQVFYSKNNPLSKELAGHIQSTVKNDLQNSNEREIKPTGTEIYLLNRSLVPSVMVECGFLSNVAESKLLETPEYRRVMAFEIFKGTCAYLTQQNLNKGNDNNG